MPRLSELGPPAKHGRSEDAAVLDRVSGGDVANNVGLRVDVFLVGAGVVLLGMITALTPRAGGTTGSSVKEIPTGSSPPEMVDGIVI